MPFLSFARPTPSALEVRLEPAYNALNSMALVTSNAQPALGAWVYRTAEALTAEDLRANRLVFGPLAGAIMIDGEWPEFPAYLADLAARPADALRDAALAAFEPDQTDPDLRSTARALLDDPAALRETVLGHLRHMWESHLAQEWQRVAKDLTQQSSGFGSFAGRKPDQVYENLRLLVEDDALAYTPQGERVAAIILVPSAHVGRHVTRVYRGSTLYLFYHAPRNYALLGRSEPIGHRELLLRLEALADETRLQILEMFATRDEITAQEVQDQLGLTQSTASRQIRGLSLFIGERRGFVGDNRGDGASKRYVLSQGQIAMTLRTLNTLISGPQPEDSDARREAGDVRRFMDRRGKITAFPARPRDKLLVLEYLAEQFEVGRGYTEREVNEIIARHLAFDDVVTIRRELYNMLLIGRKRDGSLYWRVDPAERSAILAAAEGV